MVNYPRRGERSFWTFCGRRCMLSASTGLLLLALLDGKLPLMVLLHGLFNAVNGFCSR